MVNELFAHITCSCGEKFQTLMQIGETEAGEPIFDTNHDELGRIVQEHWAACVEGGE